MSEVYKILDFNTKTMIITSVERLSDNQVFKLGDQVMHKNNVSRREGVIFKFEAYRGSDSMFVKCTNSGSGYNVPLDYLLHDDRRNTIDDLVQEELRDAYLEMRTIRNEIRDRHDKSTDYLESGRLMREVKGADKMLTVMDKYFKEQ